MTMPMLFSRTATIPVWLVVFGLFALSRSPMTFAASAVLILLGGIGLTIVLVLWKEKARRPAIAAMTVPHPPLTTPAAVDVMPNSWPNSAFRNNGQRHTRAR